jgi:hypothetical protein
MARPRPRAIPAATVLQGGEAVEGEAIAEPFRFKAAPVSAAIPERLSRVAWCSIPYPHPSPIPLPRVSACVPHPHEVAQREFTEGAGRTDPAWVQGRLLLGVPRGRRGDDL